MKDLILIQLYNRLSYYFCNKKKNEELDVNKKITIEELQKILDDYYEKQKSN